MQNKINFSYSSFETLHLTYYTPRIKVNYQKERTFCKLPESKLLERTLLRRQLSNHKVVVALLPILFK